MARRRDNASERIRRTIGLLLLVIFIAVVLAVYSDQVWPG